MQANFSKDVIFGSRHLAFFQILEIGDEEVGVCTHPADEKGQGRTDHSDHVHVFYGEEKEDDGASHLDDACKGNRLRSPGVDQNRPLEG